jgi:uncharacterized protein (TIGR03067 family)
VTLQSIPATTCRRARRQFVNFIEFPLQSPLPAVCIESYRKSATKMKASLCFVFAASMLAAAAFAADAPDDAKGIQGTWIPVKAELGGEPVPDTVLKKISLKLDDGNYLATVAGKPDKGAYTIDPKSTPKSNTVKGTEGPNKDKTFPAIYELQADTLRICYDLSEAKRPTEFKTAAGTKQYLVTYQRKAAEDKKQ